MGIILTNFEYYAEDKCIKAKSKDFVDDTTFFLWFLKSLLLQISHEISFIFIKY